MLKTSPTSLSGVIMLSGLPTVADHRGSFSRLYCQTEFKKQEFAFQIQQVNLSQTAKRGAIRGLHFQYGLAAEDKLVRCVRGCIFDVAVDLRAGSTTYGHWHGVELSHERPESLLIPKGCAHGFQTLSRDVEILYLMSANYDPSQEGGLNYACPEVGIDWPLAIEDISARDDRHPFLAEIRPVAL